MPTSPRTAANCSSRRGAPPSRPERRSSEPGPSARAERRLAQPLLDDGEDLRFALRRLALQPAPFLEDRREGRSILYPAGVGAHVEPGPADGGADAERTHPGV